MKKILLSVLVIAVATLLAVPAYAADSDGDGVADAFDNCPMNPNGNCSVNSAFCDVDGDTVVTLEEIEAGNQANFNAPDTLGDACDDADGDLYLDYLDNCPGVFNDDQNQAACTDFDGDLVMDLDDNCIERYNTDQDDRDEDGVGDICDNCMFVENPGQEDSDDDGFGDACFQDYDGDNVMDDEDNCPTVFNPGQENTSGSYRGDACEPPTTQASVSVDDEDQNRDLSSVGSHNRCTISAVPVNGSIPQGALAILLLVASAAIIVDYRKLRV